MSKIKNSGLDKYGAEPFEQQQFGTLKGLMNVQNLWTMLDKHQSPPLMPDEQMINYEDFLKVGAVSSAKCKSE